MILNRIKEYLDFKSISISAFERSIGMSNASFGKSLKSNGAIGTDKLENILSVYPDISAEWLLTGRGEMIRNESQETHPEPNLISMDLYKTSQRQVDDLINMQKQSQQQLDDVIKMYTQLLEREKRGGIVHRGNDAECADVG
jgi:hypothetical protein